MGIWKVNKIGIEQVWYPKELIDKIKEIAEDIVDKDCYENSDAKAQHILDIIKEAENE